MARQEEQETPPNPEQNGPNSEPASAPAQSEAERPPRRETPLCTIRRLADEQVSFVLQSFLGLPSITQQPSRGEWATLQCEQDGEKEEKTDTAPKGDYIDQKQTEEKN